MLTWLILFKATITLERFCKGVTISFPSKSATSIQRSSQNHYWKRTPEKKSNKIPESIVLNWNQSSGRLISNFGSTLKPMCVNTVLNSTFRVQWTKPQAWNWVGIWTYDLCNCKAVSYQLDHPDCLEVHYINIRHDLQTFLEVRLGQLLLQLLELLSFPWLLVLR